MVFLGRGVHLDRNASRRSFGFPSLPTSMHTVTWEQQTLGQDRMLHSVRVDPGPCLVVVVGLLKSLPQRRIVKLNCYIAHENLHARLWQHSIRCVRIGNHIARIGGQRGSPAANSSCMAWSWHTPCQIPGLHKADRFWVFTWFLPALSLRRRFILLCPSSCRGVRLKEHEANNELLVPHNRFTTSEERERCGVPAKLGYC